MVQQINLESKVEVQLSIIPVYYIKVVEAIMCNINPNNVLAKSITQIHEARHSNAEALIYTNSLSLFEDKLRQSYTFDTLDVDVELAEHLKNMKQHSEPFGPEYMEET